MPPDGTKSTTHGPAPGQSGRVLELIDQYETVRQELGKTAAERDLLRQKMEHLERSLGKTIEQFRELEQVLADPEQSTNAIVYYRLRAVWSICQQQLATLAQQTTARLTDPDRQRYERKIEADRQARRQAIEGRKSQVLAERVSILATIRNLEEELTRHNRVYQALARRGIERTLIAAREKLIPHDARLQALENELERADGETSPPYPGLPIGVRRDINLLLLALAQQNYLLFRADSVADHALAAHRKTLRDVRFGTAADCLMLDRSVREALVAFRGRSVDTAAVRRRAAYLRTKVRYASDRHTVPIVETLNFIHENPGAESERAQGTAFDQPIPVNVLVLDYWNVQDVLIPP